LRGRRDGLCAVFPQDPIAGYPPDPVTPVLVTLEVFDTATGQTVYTTPFAAVGFNPQPEPPEPIRSQQ